MLSFFAVLALYGILMISVCFVSYSDIHKLPGAVLQWIGGTDGHNLGENDTVSRVYAGGITVGRKAERHVKNTGNMSGAPGSGGQGGVGVNHEHMPR